MVFKTGANAPLGVPTFNSAGVDTTARVAIGAIVRGFDDVLGEGEFIYLPGVASLTAGDFVTYDLLPSAPSVTRLAAGTAANTALPVALAVAAVPAGSYGWYQISGDGIANAIAGTAAGRAFASATAGQLTSTAANGAQILGARISSAVGTPVAGQVYVTLQRPSMQSQVV